MSKRTQISQKRTTYTQTTSQAGSSSFTVNKKREMFQPLSELELQSVNPNLIITQQIGASGHLAKLLPKNVLLMHPTQIKSITWNQIYMPDQQTYVSLKGNFYCIRDSRNKQKFINRHSNPEAQTVWFNAQKNGEKLIISSIEKYFTPQKENTLFYYFHIIILNLENQKNIEQYSAIQKGFIETSTIKTASNISPKICQLYYLQFKGFQLIDNYKKAFVLFQPFARQKNRFQLIMIDFLKTNNLESSQNLSHSQSIQKMNKKVGSAFIQRKQFETYIKMSNSEYGDMVLLTTSNQIYEIQISGQFNPNQYSLILKPFIISKTFIQNKNTYISNQTNQLVLSKNIFKTEEQVVDCQYLMNGLKIMVLTSHGRVFVIEAQQCLFSESLYELLSHKQMIDNFNIQNFIFSKIYFLRGLLLVEVEADKKIDCNLVKQVKYEQSILQKLDQKNKVQNISRGLLIAKVQSNSLSFSKFISLPFSINDYETFKVTPFKEADQILLQVINKSQPQILQLHRCQILSNKNNFVPFKIENLVKQPNIIFASGKNSTFIHKNTDTKGALKITFGKSSKVFYSLKLNQISGYRVHTDELSSPLKQGIEKCISVSFFQKPLKLLINPLTGYVVIMFRQFIKLFHPTYTTLKPFLMLPLRNVIDMTFSKHGDYFLILTSDNVLHMMNSYSFVSTKIMDFYGQVKQVIVGGQYFMGIRMGKGLIFVYHKDKNLEWVKKYEVKMGDTDDLWSMDESRLVIIGKKDAQVQIYEHQIEHKQTVISNDMRDELQRTKSGTVKIIHPHLVNRKTLILQKGEYTSYLFYSSQFSTLFLGTTSGNIRQYLYPFLPLSDPTPPVCYCFPCCNSAISHIQINADFSSLYVITSLGQILQLALTQFLNSQMKSAIYTASKTQASQDKIKYEFANRTWLMDGFAILSEQVSQAIKQQYEQVTFADDKIKDDIDDVTNKIKNQSLKLIDKMVRQKKSLQSGFKQQFGQVVTKLKTQQKSLSGQLALLRQEHAKQKQSMIEEYQKQLLQIYKQNDRLKSIYTTKASQFREESSILQSTFVIALDQEIQLRKKQTLRLEEHYEQVNQKYQTYQNITFIEVQENKVELSKLKAIEIDQVKDQLKEEQLRKQSFLSQFGKVDKEIQRFKKRYIYFENLIVETRNQIEQLQTDVSQYDGKKTNLKHELLQKQSTIQEKQKQIVTFLKNTNQMKKIKNIHQFQLKQFEADILPVQHKIKQLEKQVQKMNFQIMDQFDGKVQQNDMIQLSEKRIQKLKLKNRQILNKLLQSRTTFKRFTQELQSILSDPFNLKVRQKLAKTIDKYSLKQQVFIPNQELQKGKKQGQKLMRKKNILRKAIEQENKLQQGILKNKNQFFRFYVDNTNLVKQHNELFKDHNMLIHDKKKLEQKIASIKTQMYQTPLKRSASLHIRKISEKKLTPFQRYEQEQMQFANLKIKDTTQTRASRGQQSASFLKSLIKDVSITESNYEKAHLVRDRIRTFVNPQMQRKVVQKQLFQRQRGKSNHIPLLKL